MQILQAGARVEINPSQRKCLRFCKLWKASKENELRGILFGERVDRAGNLNACMCNKFIEGDLDIQGGADLFSAPRK